MKKVILYFVLTFASHLVFAQDSTLRTTYFSVTGLVEAPISIHFSEILDKNKDTLGDFKITNHKGEFRRVHKNVQGVKLLELIRDVKINESNPKLLSEYYFIFKASDGYSVVVSWNELYNTEIGEAFYIVVEADGKSLQNSPEGILLICTKDLMTGRRHIKGLKSIEVKRIN